MLEEEEGSTCGVERRDWTSVVRPSVDANDARNAYDRSGKKFVTPINTHTAALYEIRIDDDEKLYRYSNVVLNVLKSSDDFMCEIAKGRWDRIASNTWEGGIDDIRLFEEIGEPPPFPFTTPSDDFDRSITKKPTMQQQQYIQNAGAEQGHHQQHVAAEEEEFPFDDIEFTDADLAAIDEAVEIALSTATSKKPTSSSSSASVTTTDHPSTITNATPPPSTRRTSARLSGQGSSNSTKIPASPPETPLKKTKTRGRKRKVDIVQDDQGHDQANKSKNDNEPEDPKWISYLRRSKGVKRYRVFNTFVDGILVDHVGAGAGGGGGGGGGGNLKGSPSRFKTGAGGGSNEDGGVKKKLRAYLEGNAVDPVSAEWYIRSKFGARYEDAKRAFTLLASTIPLDRDPPLSSPSITEEEYHNNILEDDDDEQGYTISREKDKISKFGSIAYNYYERFRPEVFADGRGWGQSGVLDLGRVVRLWNGEGGGGSSGGGSGGSSGGVREGHLFG
ncbi:hypothetical protein HDU76_003427 [Blyttiomyces sp. JEL0837]|nr:hypothetical protein HDU76_003427 [Blyttiomyces sp. JEL0837]